MSKTTSNLSYLPFSQISALSCGRSHYADRSKEGALEEMKLLSRILLFHWYPRVVDPQSVGAWKSLSHVNELPENPCGSWNVILEVTGIAFKAQDTT